MSLIIFDLDGTLFCSHLCIITAVNTTLRKLNLPQVTSETILSLIGEKYEVLANGIAPGFTDLDLLFRLYTQSEHETIRNEAQLFDGVPETLNQLVSAGHKLAICSNGSMEYIELALSSAGIRDLFDAVVSGSDFPSKSEAISYLTELFHVSDAVVVGDRYHDIQAASDNKLPSIAALYGYGNASELAAATTAANSAADIPALVRDILKNA